MSETRTASPPVSQAVSAETPEAEPVQSEELQSGAVATVDQLEDLEPGNYACVPVHVIDEILQYLQTDQWCKVNRIMMGLQGVRVLKIEEPNGKAQEAAEAT